MIQWRDVDKFNLRAKTLLFCEMNSENYLKEQLENKKNLDKIQKLSQSKAFSNQNEELDVVQENEIQELKKENTESV